MRFYEIPLSPEPQRFSIALGGRTRRLRLGWNAAEAAWLLDIAVAARRQGRLADSDSSDNEEDDTPLLAGIPLVAGADLLAQHAHMGLGGELWVEGELPPGVSSLGVESKLIFAVKEN
jgi:hypothetical protein